MSELSEMSGPQSASPHSSRALGAHEVCDDFEIVALASMAQWPASPAGLEALLDVGVKETMRRDLVGRLAAGRKAARARRNSKGGAK